MSDAQRSSRVSVDGIEGLFATKTGGSVTAATNDVWNGGDDDAEKLASPPTVADLVLDKPYDAARDRALLDQLERVVGRARFTVQEQDVDADGTPIGAPKVWTDALFTVLNPPDYDASSGKEKRWGMTFAVRRRAQ